MRSEICSYRSAMWLLGPVLGLAFLMLGYSAIGSSCDPQCEVFSIASISTDKYYVYGPATAFPVYFGNDGGTPAVLKDIFRDYYIDAEGCCACDTPICNKYPCANGAGSGIRQPPTVSLVLNSVCQPDG